MKIEYLVPDPSESQLVNKINEIIKVINKLNERTVGMVRVGPNPYDLSSFPKKEAK